MAILLDERYVLLTERPTAWLERCYDGWDEVEDVPITVGWFSTFDPLPVLPSTIRLRHPSIVSLLDIRIDPGAGTWVIWEHFGDTGSGATTGVEFGHRVTAWMLHESVAALGHAREGLGRPGGFRVADFQPDMLRLYHDGRVKVTGFGRLSAESPTADEFARLAAWGGEWLSHGHASPQEQAEGSVAGELVEALGRLQTADAQPQGAVPRITAGLRPHLEGGQQELGLWVGARGFEHGAEKLKAYHHRYLESPGEVHRLSTRSLEAVEAEREAVELPRVRIAPIPREIDPEAEKTYKGLPRERKEHLPWILVGVAILLIAYGSYVFKPWSETKGESQLHQAWLETVPDGASVFIDDTLRMGKTPLGQDGLATGWHKVRFEKPEFSGLEDSILIYKQGAHRPFKFVFARPLRVESRPAGAIVYLNGRREPHPTPCLEGGWPATQGISVVMHLEQYGSLEDCVLDPMYGTLEVKDPAAWSVTRAGDTLVVRGLFVSTVSFFASPPDCRLRVDDTLTVDPTGVVTYTLTYGLHRLQADAVGFDALDTTILISGRTEKLLPVVLSRPVRINAFDPDHPGTDLRVLVDRLEGPQRSLQVRRFTPYSVRVPAVAHTVTLTKRNYQDTTVYIPPDVTKVDVAMRRGTSAPPVALEATAVAPPPEAESAPPAAPSTSTVLPWITISVQVPGKSHLAGAEIYARAAGESDEQWLGITDDKGELQVQVPEGNYDLLAYLDAFSGVRKRVKVRNDRNRPVIIDLRR